MIRLFKSRAFWLLFLSFIFSLGFWYISTWDKSIIYQRVKYPYPWNQTVILNDIYETLLNNKIKIGVIFGITLLIFQSIILYFPLSLKRKDFIKSTLSHIIKQYMKGKISNNRITIYVNKKGYEFFFKYMWNCFIKNRKKHKKKNLLGIYRKELPNLFKRYLVFFGRTGKPFESGTTTFFTVPESPEEISGLVSYVFYHETPKFVELPDISEIDIDNLTHIDQINNEFDRDLVKNYMVLGEVTSFDKLKMFHRLPQHLYATPIYNKKNKPYGVIVFDSLEKSDDFKNNIDNLLGYCRITESIINYIN